VNVIIMLGAQGAGKGTQAERLAAKLQIPTISVGKLFRAEIEKNTGLGRAIAEYVDRGDRVPTDMVDQVMSERLTEEDTKNGFILDGYPRTHDQVSALDKILAGAGMKVSHVLYVNVSDAEALRRLSGRWVCSNLKCEANYHETFNPPKKQAGKCDVCGSDLIQRADDKPDAIRHRLELYHKDTTPLIDEYRGAGLLHEINGEQPIAKVEQDIDGIFGL
jgi:adenylate kinase